MTLESVEKLFRKRRAEITAEMCEKCVVHVEHVELSYWKTDRIIDLKMDQLDSFKRDHTYFKDNVLACQPHHW